MVNKCLPILLLSSVFCLYACGPDKYTWSKEKWICAKATMHKKDLPFFDEIHHHKLKELQGQLVQVRGKLIYHYDEAAIYPFNEGDFRPVWINVNAENTALHEFLLAHEGGMVTATGTIDTTNLMDRYIYSSALAEINHISAMSLKENIK